MRTLRRTIVTAASASLLTLAGPAAAAPPPTTFGFARDGTFSLVSSVLPTARAVDMRGVWTDTALGCLEWRSLTVRILVQFTPRRGQGRIVRRARTRPVQNCAEGGPNMGFTLTARGVGLACPNGAWRPGRYDFVTDTLHVARGLHAVATLFWPKGGRC